MNSLEKFYDKKGGGDAEITPPKINHKEMWDEIVKETEDIRQEVEEIKNSRRTIAAPPPHPTIDYLNKEVFPILNPGIIQLLKKIKDQENQIFTEGDTYLNSLNVLAEYLWNMNNRHPNRKYNWKDVSQIFKRH